MAAPSRPTSRSRSYPDDILKKAAEALVNAKTFRFDGGDNMPQAMNDAFFKAIVSYAQDPSKLDSILTNLDSVQASSYTRSPRLPAGRGPPVLPAAHRHSEA